MSGTDHPCFPVMANDQDRERKSLGERLRELAEELLESLDSLLQPQPELVPVPVRGGRRR